VQQFAAVVVSCVVVGYVVVVMVVVVGVDYGPWWLSV
jgi:hypothetical protein